MGKVTDSLLSGTRGRTGRIVVSNIQGNEISRVRPIKRSRPLTPKQQLVTARFNAAIQFIQGYKTLVKSYYGKRKGLKSPYNIAMSNLIKAMPLDTENLLFTINYQSIMFTKGNLPEPQVTAFSSVAPLTIELNWNNNALTQEQANDQLYVMLTEVDSETNTTSVIQTMAKRSDESYEIELLPNYAGVDVHLWISFINPTLQDASNSISLGTLTITP